MDGDRKYRQNGYQDTRPRTDDRSRENGRDGRDDKPRPQGPRLPIDVTGPRLPRLVQAVTAARCFNCASTLASDIDFQGSCPKCNAALHCCKQCAHFEPSTRFQCLKPILVRIAQKDQANQCASFKPRLTVARDSAPASPAATAVPANIPVPRSASDARTAFDNLFRKPTTEP